MYEGEGGRNEFGDLNSHLANERTHLSLVRTALAFVSFGITLNRFSIFLLDHQSPGHARGSSVLEHSKLTGLGMVLLGLFLLIWSVTRYRHVLRAIEERKFVPPQLSFTVITTIFIGLSIVGAALLIFA